MNRAPDEPTMLAMTSAADRKTARATVIGFVLVPLAFALAIPAWRIGAGARASETARLLSEAESTAEALRIMLSTAPPEDPASAVAATLVNIDPGTRAAYYDAAAGWSAIAMRAESPARGAAPAPAGRLPPGALDARTSTRLVSRDRAITTRVGGRTAVVAPVKDATAWDMVGAVLLVRNAADPARVPARPLAVAAGAWMLSAAAALAWTRRRRPWVMLLSGLTAALGMALLARWPGPGSHGLWSVFAFAGWAILATIGAGLASMAHRPLAFREARCAWAFLAPSLAHLVVFSIGPILFSLWLSFHEWDLLVPARPFVGLDNYRELAADGDFLRALRNTAVYVLFVPIGMIVALGLALLVDRRLPGVRLLRTVFFLPYVTSFVAISLVWRWMFQPDVGLFNNVLARFGVPAQPWLSSPATALPSLMLMSVWMYAGYMMVLFLAGLQNIPVSLHESARIDGANAWQRFRRITLPLLRPTALFVLVTMVIFMFQVFTAVYIMTEGGPLHATDVIVYHIYRNAWEYLRMGYASAMAWMLFAILFVITLVQFRWLGARPH